MIIKKRTLKSLLYGILFFLISLTCWSEGATNNAEKAHSKVTLLTTHKTWVPGSQQLIGIRFQLEPDWHTYWEYGGEVGQPTTFSSTVPEGWAIEPFSYPIPQRYEAFGFPFFGYEHEAIFLSRVTVPQSATGENTITIKVDWLSCKESCIPGDASLSLTLPTELSETTSDSKQLLQEALTRVPKETVAPESFQVQRDSQWHLSGSEPQASQVEFFPLTYDLIDEAQNAQASFDSQGNWRLSLDPSPKINPEAALEGLLVFRDPNHKVVRSTYLKKGAPLTPSGSEPTASKTSASGLLLTLFVAFLGGMLLNLMPCVFPVLSIKVLGFVRDAQNSKHSPTQHGLAFVAGVVLSFWILTAIFLSLRAAGTALGWGFQLSNPYSISILAGLFFLIGLNLFGVFHIGESFSQLGDQVPQSDGLGSSFWSGVLATVIATPCTGPGMGAAIGYTATASSWEVFLVMTAIALGMSLPYLLLSSSPNLIKRLPRPGAWMETFEQFMGFPMMLTVIFLFHIQFSFLTLSGLTRSAVALLVLAMAAWIYGKHQEEPSTVKIFLSLFLLMISLWIGAQAIKHHALKAQQTQQASHTQWAPFSEAALNKALSNGERVFIDFGASWCLTCQANESLVLHTEEMLTFFQDQKVTLMYADWTTQDPNITKVLNQNGRNGVPMYLYYESGSSQPYLLPELLTKEVVQKAISPKE